MARTIHELDLKALRDLSVADKAVSMVDYIAADKHGRILDGMDWEKHYIAGLESPYDEEEGDNHRYLLAHDDHFIVTVKVEIGKGIHGSEIEEMIYREQGQ